MNDSDLPTLLRGPGDRVVAVDMAESVTSWIWVRRDVACLYGAFALHPEHPRFASFASSEVPRWSGWITFPGLTEANWVSGPEVEIPATLCATGEEASQSSMGGSEPGPDGTLLDLGFGELQLRCQDVHLELDPVPCGQPGPVPIPGNLAPLALPLQDRDTEDLLPELATAGIPLATAPLFELAVEEGNARFSWVQPQAPDPPPSFHWVGREVQDIHWHELRICPDPTGRFPAWEPRLHGLRRRGTRYAAWGPWGAVEWSGAGFEIRTSRSHCL